MYCGRVTWRAASVFDSSNPAAGWWSTRRRALRCPRDVKGHDAGAVGAAEGDPAPPPAVPQQIGRADAAVAVPAVRPALAGRHRLPERGAGPAYGRALCGV